MDFLHAVDSAGIEQDALAERGLARVDMGRNADVAQFCQVHDDSPRNAEPCIIVDSSRPCKRGNETNQLFDLGNGDWRSTGILPVFFGHGQDARAT